MTNFLPPLDHDLISIKVVVAFAESGVTPEQMQLGGGCRMRRVPANNSSASQQLSRLLPFHWYARNVSCQQMLPTHDDALGIRMDAEANFNPGPRGITVGLSQCPWFGILLFIESMQNNSLPAHRLNIAPTFLTWNKRALKS